MSDAMRLVGWPCVYLLGALVIACQSDIRRAIGQYLIMLGIRRVLFAAGMSIFFSALAYLFWIAVRRGMI
jgi:hypothetical protein